ncbi:hypothetical protein EDC01DRAFT_109033 [Geopyxis carbonaria]|nr:hypothetical protein EDC01DRAFT_109033 [Geopyxis carbonaria]
MSDITPIPAIPPHMRHFLRRPQQDEASADTPSVTPPTTQGQLPDTELLPSRTFGDTSGILNLNPSLTDITVAKTTLLDFFDPAGIFPSYTSLLEAMDYVCGTTVWVDFEDFLLGKGFGYEFWVVVSANTSQHLGLRRAELLEKLTSGKIKSDMVGQVVTNWEFVWRLAVWLVDGGEVEDAGPVRKLLECSPASSHDCSEHA